MIAHIRQRRLPQLLQPIARAIGRTRHALFPGLVRQPLASLAFAACALAALYWGLLASDRYVSEAHIIIQRTDTAGSPATDVASLLSGSVSESRSDQLLLRNQLLSANMLDKLDAKLDLRSHYSDKRRDFFSRMWSRDVPQEWFHRHYLSRVSIEFDEYTGVLLIKAQGYDPKTAHAIASVLVEEGERAMNQIARQLALEQVGFVAQQVANTSTRLQQARGAVLAYQNEKGLVSPESTAESLAGVINHLEAQRSELQARRNAMLGYLSPQASSVMELNYQIAAIEKQIAGEKARLAAPNGKTLNRTVEEFQRLQMEANFAQDIYKTALVAFEKGHVDATRTLKKVSVLQTPILPQYPLEPRRIYNITVFILLALLLTGIAQLLAAIIRDHRD